MVLNKVWFQLFYFLSLKSRHISSEINGHVLKMISIFTSYIYLKSVPLYYWEKRGLLDFLKRKIR